MATNLRRICRALEWDAADVSRRAPLESIRLPPASNPPTRPRASVDVRGCMVQIFEVDLACCACAICPVSFCVLRAAPRTLTLSRSWGLAALRIRGPCAILTRPANEATKRISHQHHKAATQTRSIPVRVAESDMPRAKAGAGRQFRNMRQAAKRRERESGAMPRSWKETQGGEERRRLGVALFAQEVYVRRPHSGSAAMSGSEDIRHGALDAPQPQSPPCARAPAAPRSWCAAQRQRRDAVVTLGRPFCSKVVGTYSAGCQPTLGALFAMPEAALSQERALPREAVGPAHERTSLHTRSHKEEKPKAQGTRRGWARRVAAGFHS